MNRASSRLGIVALCGGLASLVWLAVPTKVPTGQQPLAAPTATAVPTSAVPLTPVVSNDPAAQAAIEVAIWEARMFFPVLSGMPTAIHAQRVMFADLPYLGITGMPPARGNEEPFWVIVVQGDFDPGPRNAVPLPDGTRPHLDYVLALVSEPTNRLAHLAVAPHMYGLGCVFKNPSLPGGLTECTGPFLAHGLRTLQTPRPTPLPPEFFRGYSPEDLQRLREGAVPGLTGGSPLVLGTPASATPTPAPGTAGTPLPTRDLNR